MFGEQIQGEKTQTLELHPSRTRHEGRDDRTTHNLFAKPTGSTKRPRQLRAREDPQSAESVNPTPETAVRQSESLGTPPYPAPCG